MSQSLSPKLPPSVMSPCLAAAMQAACHVDLNYVNCFPGAHLGVGGKFRAFARGETTLTHALTVSYLLTSTSLPIIDALKSTALGDKVHLCGEEG